MQLTSVEASATGPQDNAATPDPRKRTEKMESKVTVALSPMVRSQDSVASVVHMEVVVEAEASETVVVPDMEDTVVVHQDAMELSLKAMTLPESQKANAAHAATVIVHQDAEDSDEVDSEEVPVVDLVAQALPAAVIIQTLKTKHTRNSSEK